VLRGQVSGKNPHSLAMASSGPWGLEDLNSDLAILFHLRKNKYIFKKLLEGI